MRFQRQRRAVPGLLRRRHEDESKEEGGNWKGPSAGLGIDKLFANVHEPYKGLASQ